MSYNRYPMPTPNPTPDSSDNRSSSPYRYDGYPNQVSGNQVTYYNNNQVHQNQSLSTNNFHKTQVVAPQTHFVGNSYALLVGDKRVTISQAGVSAFCNDFVSTELAKCHRLTAKILDDLAKQGKISIHYSKSIAGSTNQKKFATELPKAAIAAGLIAAVGAYSQLKVMVDAFFKYEYLDDVISGTTYHVEYVVNDEYTVTGCFLSKVLKSKHESLKIPLVNSKSTSIKYDIQCYLFTFKVAQAAPYIHKHLSR